MKVRLWLCFVVAVASVGCASEPGAFSAAVFSAEAAKAPYASFGEPIEESACMHSVFLVVWGNSSNHSMLVSRALSRTGSAALFDAHLVEEDRGLPPFYTEHCVIVRGRPAQLTVPPTASVARGEP